MHFIYFVSDFCYIYRHCIFGVDNDISQFDQQEKRRGAKEETLHITPHPRHSVAERQPSIDNVTWSDIYETVRNTWFILCKFRAFFFLFFFFFPMFSNQQISLPIQVGYGGRRYFHISHGWLNSPGNSLIMGEEFIQVSTHLLLPHLSKICSNKLIQGEVDSCLSFALVLIIFHTGNHYCTHYTFTWSRLTFKSEILHPK